VVRVDRDLILDETNRTRSLTVEGMLANDVKPGGVYNVSTDDDIGGILVSILVLKSSVLTCDRSPVNVNCLFGGESDVTVAGIVLRSAITLLDEISISFILDDKVDSTRFGGGITVCPPKLFIGKFMSLGHFEKSIYCIFNLGEVVSTLALTTLVKFGPLIYKYIAVMPAYATYPKSKVVALVL
jgi:hypothetical protein